MIWKAKYNTAGSKLYTSVRTKSATTAQVSPTLAVGDVKVSLDGGALANIEVGGGSVSVAPAGSDNIEITLSAAQTTCKVLKIEFKDVAGSQWDEQHMIVTTWGDSNAFDPVDYTKLGASTSTMLIGTVDTFVATTSIFETNITEATAQHFNGRLIIFTSGALFREVCIITDYLLNAGKGKFTVSTKTTTEVLTDIPANGDTFIIV